MSSVNKVFLIGRCGKDPEVKQVTGTTVAKFSLATSENWKDKDGNKKEETTWHNIVIWGKLCDVVQKYVKKGDLLYVEGKIKTEKWEKDGVTNYRTNIVVDQLTMLGSKSDKSEQKDEPSPNKPESNMGRTTAPDADGPSDLPF
jgi:single-strand DNA-binding protein